MLSKPKLVTAPAKLAIALSTVKEFLRIDTDAEDTALKVMIKAATSRIEEYIDKKIVNQKWNIFYDGFKIKTGGMDTEWWDGVRDGAISMLQVCEPEIKLPFGNLSTVESFKTFDDEDEEYIFSSINYHVDSNSDYGRIVLKKGKSWPTTTLRTVNGICIEAIFGYGEGADEETGITTTPEDIATAILNFVAVIYERRGDELPKIPDNALMLLEPYKNYRIG